LHLQPKVFKPVSLRKEPPRLVVVENDGDLSGFIFCDGLVIEIPSSSVQDMLLQLLHCYYAWGLTYPKQFQILPFLQEHILQDSDATLYRSTAYNKLNMHYLNN
jgi:hypothetical protein